MPAENHVEFPKEEAVSGKFSQYLALYSGRPLDPVSQMQAHPCVNPMSLSREKQSVDPLIYIDRPAVDLITRK
jgi:hypothetical protein